MLTFKQYLIENNQLDNTDIKIGDYSISPIDALSNRLGSTQKALDYLESIKQRRAEHSSEIDPQWFLPSVDSDDYSEKVKVQVSPGMASKGLGYAPFTALIDKEKNVVVDYKKSNPEIQINTNARSQHPEGMESIQKDLVKVSNELQPNGKYKKDTGALTDVLWHELQHVLALKNLKRNNKSVSDFTAQGYDYSSKDPAIPSALSTYATSPGELPAHMSENKMRFFETSGILLDPNFTDEQFENYKEWLKTDKNKQSAILLQLFNDPKKGKQAKEFLRQIAQTNKRDTGEMMA